MPKLDASLAWPFQPGRQTPTMSASSSQIKTPRKRPRRSPSPDPVEDDTATAADTDTERDDTSGHELEDDDWADPDTYTPDSEAHTPKRPRRVPPSERPPPEWFDLLDVSTVIEDPRMDHVLVETPKADTPFDSYLMWPIDCDRIQIIGYFCRGDQGMLFKCRVPNVDQLCVVKLVSTLVELGRLLNPLVL